MYAILLDIIRTTNLIATEFIFCVFYMRSNYVCAVYLTSYIANINYKESATPYNLVQPP